MFSKLFLRFSTRTLHLPKRCRLVSYSSPQRGHIGSSIFSKVKCRFSVLCPVRRATKIFKSFHDNLTAYFATLVLLLCRSCLACRQLWILFHFLFCSWTNHWQAMFLTLVEESPNTGSGPVKSVIAACFAKLSAISLPSMMLCPRFHSSQTQLWIDELCNFVMFSQTNPDVVLAVEIVFNAAWKVVTISSWLNFGCPAPSGRGSATGRKFLAPPYYSQRAVFASLRALFFH